MVVGLLLYLWFRDTRISLILGVAMTANLIVAAVAGITDPLTVCRLKIDPA
ncbi:MAG: magnesium transporter [Candidatus Thiodiazotropha sp.]